MPIITTSRRIRQITWLLIGCLLLTAGIVSYRAFQINVQQPQAVIDRFVQYAVEDKPWHLQWVDVEAIRAEAIADVSEALKVDLAGTNVPDLSAATASLAELAIEPLLKPAGLKQWLRKQQRSMRFPEEGVAWHSLENGRKQWSSAQGCLVVERQNKQWRLVSVLACEPA